MHPKLRAAFLVLAAVCLLAALYYPASQYIEGRALDDEMRTLRQMKTEAAAVASLSNSLTEQKEPASAVPSTAMPESGQAVAEITGETTQTDRSTVSSDSSDVGLIGETRLPDDAHIHTRYPSETSSDFAQAESAVTASDSGPFSGPAPTTAPEPEVKNDDPLARTKSAQESAHPTAGMQPGSAVLPQVTSANPVSSQPVAEPEPTPSPTPFVFDEDRILPEYRPMYEINHDMVGWLKIEGTTIDYPVLQRNDEAYYLTRDFYGRNNKNGQLILDAQCDAFEPSANLVISGHNMKSGAMFGSLQQYASRGFGRKHPILEFDTLFERNRYRLVAAFYAWDYEKRGDGFRYNADITYRLEMIRFLEELDQIKLYDTGVTVEFGDRLITLSTCSNETDDGRFVIVARLLREDETS